MKKIVLPIIALLAMIFPVLTGCGEKGETFNVEVVLEKAPSTDPENENFRLSDCARATGAGEYERGTRATIKVDLVNTCKIAEWTINGELSETYTRSSSMRDIIVDGDKKVVVKITKDPDSVQLGLYTKFIGISSRASSTSEYEAIPSSITNVAFPSAKSDAKVTFTHTKTNAVPIDERTITFANIIKNYYLDSTESIGEMDYTYTYFDNEIQLGRVTWQAASYDKSNDSCSNWATIPSSESITESICFRGLLDKGDNTKTDGVDALLTSEIFVSKGDACLETSRSTAISEECYYVSNAKKLINHDILGDVLYYGYANTGDTQRHLEAVVTSGTLKYTICMSDMLGASCRVEDTYQSVIIDRENLSINQFLNDVNSGGTGAVTKWEYSSAVNKVVPVKLKVGTREYNITYFGTGVNPSYNNLVIRFDDITSVTPAKFYLLEAEKDDANDTDIDEAITALNLELSKIYNRFYTTNVANNNYEELRRKIYVIIGTREDLKVLRNYYIQSVEYTADTSKLKITFAKSTFEEVDKSGTLTTLSANSKTCYYADADCIKAMISNIDDAVYSTIKTIMENGSKNLLNIEDISVNEEDEIITYVIDGKTYEFIYNSANETYTIKLNTALLGVMSVADEDNAFTYDYIETSEDSKVLVINKTKIVAIDGEGDDYKDINDVLRTYTYYKYDTSDYILKKNNKVYYLSYKLSEEMYEITFNSTIYKVANGVLDDEDAGIEVDVILANIGGIIDDHGDLNNPITHILALNDDAEFAALIVVEYEGEEDKASVGSFDDTMGVGKVQKILTDDNTTYYNVKDHSDLKAICYGSGINAKCSLMTKDSDSGKWSFTYNKQVYQLSEVDALHPHVSINDGIDTTADYTILASTNFVGLPINQLLTCTYPNCNDPNLIEVVTYTGDAPENVITGVDQTGIKNFNSMLKSAHLYEINDNVNTYLILQTDDSAPLYYIVEMDGDVYYIDYSVADEYSQTYAFSNINN